MDNYIKRRLTTYNKNKNKKEWFKRMMDFLDYRTNFNRGDVPAERQSESFGNNTYSQERRREMRINYNLFNSIIDKKDFEHVYKPFGQDTEDLPADFTNKDIVSGKIKVLLGMEMERPFSWRVAAVNEEATTRKEEAQFGMYRDYVVQQIMEPIYAKVEGMDPSQQQEQIEAMTPDRVKKYMEREHQDPAEVMGQQILDYLVKYLNIKHKFNRGWKDGILSSYEIYWIGLVNDEPMIERVNPMFFEFDKDYDGEFFEDAEWAGTEWWLTPSQVISMFGDELTETQLDDLYSGYSSQPEQENDFTFDNTYHNYGKVRVLHRAWRALTKYGFFSYIDDDGMLQETLVDDSFKFNTENPRHISIVWEWLGETFEGYKINSDIYVRLRKIPGQDKNLDNLHDCKLPYVGAIYDNTNSQPTSLMDRIRQYQYYYNIIMYRIEMLMASDKGKLLLLNMNMIPNSSGIDLKQWLYYSEALKIGFMNPAEEGNQAGGDVTNAAKEIDMSLISDIQKYVELATYTEVRCGEAIGVTKEMEGRIGQYQAVGSVKEAVQRGSYVVEPYFELHNQVKQRALEMLLNVGRYAYSYNDKKKLDYILDDFSRVVLTLDKEMLWMSHYGLFVTDSMQALQVKEAINQLSHAAIQNQTADLSDVIKILRTNSIPEAEEILKAAEARKRKQQTAAQEQQQAHDQKMLESAQQQQEKEWEHEIELVVIKETERRETELQKQAILAMGFNEDKDMNRNDIPDVLEVAMRGIETDVKQRKQLLEENKFTHQKDVDTEKLKLEKRKLEKSSAQ